MSGAISVRVSRLSLVQRYSIMNIEIRDDRFRQIVGESVTFEILSSGFAFAEGPIWHPYEQHLRFSDIVGSRQFQWSQGEGLSIYREQSNMANGNTYGRQGRVVTCEHATNRVVRTQEDGSLETLASHYQGKELNSPNDVVVAPDGGIYFTDPPFGRVPYYGKPRKQELSFQGVYRIDPVDNSLGLLVDDFSYQMDSHSLWTIRSYI
jgi:gluconolactonase